MIWFHCGDTTEVTITASLVTRLAAQIDGHRVLITADDAAAALLTDIPEGVKVVTPPVDTPSKTRAFLDQWAPRALVWVGGALRPALLRGVEKSGVHATLINARNTALFPRGTAWLPRAVRNAMSPFQQIMTADGATATRITRGGIDRKIVEATGPILEDPIPPEHNQYELAVMAEALDTRPIWFAADVVTPEITHMAAAHLAASRKSHRLLLLITPRDIDSGPVVGEILREAGLKVGVRSDGDNPEAEHQAYVADLPGENGLWCRIAPLTFIGGTLSGGSQMSPFDPIVLGSAVIHGTHKFPHEARYERLAKAEACREVRSAAELGIAVGALISPEQTARMALAGWEEVTQNALSINQLVEDCVDHLEAAK